MGNNPSPKTDALRAMRLANYEASHRGLSRDRAPLPTSVEGTLCAYAQPKTGLTCTKPVRHAGHHKFTESEG